MTRRNTGTRLTKRRLDAATADIAAQPAWTRNLRFYVRPCVTGLVGGYCLSNFDQDACVVAIARGCEFCCRSAPLVQCLLHARHPVAFDVVPPGHCPCPMCGHSGRRLPEGRRLAARWAVRPYWHRLFCSGERHCRSRAPRGARPQEQPQRCGIGPNSCLLVATSRSLGGTDQS